MRTELLRYYELIANFRHCVFLLPADATLSSILSYFSDVTYVCIVYRRFMYQELTEKEITTTEVLHMECRETGEFAHRETTNYEQSETFNDELVAEEKGNEEYVHMKSIDDEYEFLDSNMPKKEAPPEPDPGTPYTPGGDGGENYENYPNSPSDRADEKPMHNTAMHELNVSDDDDDGRRYGMSIICECGCSELFDHVDDYMCAVINISRRYAQQ